MIEQNNSKLDAYYLSIEISPNIFKHFRVDKEVATRFKQLELKVKYGFDEVLYRKNANKAYIQLIDTECIDKPK
jgi:hypothetical protein